MKLSAENLKKTLWDVLLLAKDGKIDPVRAGVIASSSREIMRVVNAEIKIASLSGKKPSREVIGSTQPKTIEATSKKISKRV